MPNICRTPWFHYGSSREISVFVWTCFNRIQKFQAIQLSRVMKKCWKTENFSKRRLVYKAWTRVIFLKEEYKTDSNYPAAAAKSLQSCPTLCDPIDGSPPASPVPGILQARTLEWVAISFFNAWKWKVKVKLLSRVWFLATPWTAAHQAPPSMGFSRQEYWSGVPLPSPSKCPRRYLFNIWLVTVTCTLSAMHIGFN